MCEGAFFQFQISNFKALVRKGEQKILPDFITSSLSLPPFHIIPMRLFLLPDCFLNGLGVKDYLSSDSLVSCLLRSCAIVFLHSVLKVFINMESTLCFEINMTVFSVSLVWWFWSFASHWWLSCPTTHFHFLRIMLSLISQVILMTLGCVLKNEISLFQGIIQIWGQ